MNGAHWHLMINHLPIIFPLVGIIVMITGIVSKSEVVRRTACMIFIIGSLSAIPAMTTGEGAEEVVKNISGVTENYIEEHEETAETFSILSYILGCISLIGIWSSFKQRTFSNMISIGTLAFAILVLFFARQTGNTGGEIRHTEIRSGSSTPASKGNDFEKED
jgi:uncharacterized membrane protein